MFKLSRLPGLPPNLSSWVTQNDNNNFHFALVTFQVGSQMMSLLPTFFTNMPKKRGEVNLRHDLIKHLSGDQECIDFARAHCDLSSFFAFPARGLHWYLP